MSELLYFIVTALQITLLDIVLSGDNLGLIALAIRNLPAKQAKIATLTGVGGAIGFRIIFASLMTTIMAIRWLPIRLVGGILLLKITWNLITANAAGEEEGHVASAGTFWKAVASIIVADMSMSLDNVLAVGGAADGNIGLIAFGIFLNLPILFFGSQLVANLMNKYRVIIFAGAAILTHTALHMVLEDQLLAPFVPHLLTLIFPWLVALGVFCYGVYLLKKAEWKGWWERQCNPTEQDDYPHQTLLERIRSYYIEPKYGERHVKQTSLRKSK